ncbi:MAG: nucleotide pyrophosphatase/phosphodiesterase family protein, partial [Verrucomicrobiota bacterium]
GEHTPFIRDFAARAESQQALIEPLLPAVTSTMQATYLTGKVPGEHGIVANYWYDRDYAEHRGWKQANKLVQGKKLWEYLREDNPDYTCAKVFWWNNLYSSAEYSITPRPIYCADGKKVFDVQTWPMDLREEIKADIGNFPFPYFWGPVAGLPSSKWIADSAKWFENRFSPNLNLVYLPHLDYNLQRIGPEGEGIEQDFREIDSIVADLTTHLESRGVKVILLSEYGITQVDRPIHINRVFREKGWLSWRDELGRDTLDIGNCQALAISDHQLAHIYVGEDSLIDEVKRTVAELDGVDRVLSGDEIAAHGLDHERSGDLVAISDERSWFTYYFWADDERAPDYARSVDIHRKPGYDPAELFFDPAIGNPKLKMGLKLVRKKLGFRTLMDVIPLDADLVKGSHGCVPKSTDDFPLIIGELPQLAGRDQVKATDVFGLLKSACEQS